VFKVSTDETIEHIQVFTGLCALYTELSHRKSLFRQNCHAQLQLLIEPSVGGVILLLCVSVSVCLSVCTYVCTYVYNLSCVRSKRESQFLKFSEGQPPKMPRCDAIVSFNQKAILIHLSLLPNSRNTVILTVYRRVKIKVFLISEKPSL